MTDKTSQMPFLRETLGAGETTLSACGIRLDISRQRLSAGDLSWLRGTLARERELLPAFLRMVSGERVNPSEGRSALHTSLRSFSRKSPMFEEVAEERKRIFAFAAAVREGQWRGCRNDRITDVINVGIGGSDLGPHTVWHALQGTAPAIRLHFLASVDGVLFDRTVARCNPRTTLVVVSSKSFGTRETMVNASALDQWLLDNGIVGADRSHHLVVVSANPEAPNIMCLPQENFFHLWDWVGGRFSVWSAIGLPVVIGLGPTVFREFLQGAFEMDHHAETAPLERNLPATLALLAWWNAVKLHVPMHCLLPYDERLRGLVGWLQQLEMESLGKHMTWEGARIEGPTGQAVWGANGNEGQHSFYQWLREGTGNSSIDLVWSDMPGHRHAEHYRTLVANARAQAEALVARDPEAHCFNALSTIVLDAVTPRRLGTLMALYEHKTAMLGTLFGLNAFDQPGVELGKRLSKAVEAGEDPRDTLRSEGVL